MRKPFLIVLALAAAPMAAQAETINLYGWQNHSWEFVDIDGGRSFDRIQSNAGNIGFGASVDTGMDGIHVTLQCEQFTYYNHLAGGTGWCNRNSKIGLKHPQAGEIMLATWLLPYNEGVAQWVDPFYDAGADSHTSIMGSVGANTIFYNTGTFDFQASGGSLKNYDFVYTDGYNTGFNRRQENIIQYWSPNWNGFVFRFAWTAGNNDETAAPRGGGEIDPIIRSSSLAYTNGPLWLAVTWQDHEDWSAYSVGEMASSDAESFRLAGRYIMDMGDGVSVQVSAMWEDLEYEFNNVSGLDTAMTAFGFKDLSMKTISVLGDDQTTNNDDTTGTEITSANFGNFNCGTDADGNATRCNTDTDDSIPDNTLADARNYASMGSNLKVERDAWMVSGKVKFGGPVDFRFSYMDADDLEFSGAGSSFDLSDTAADAWNVGLFYTMPAGTELRLTYSEVDNDKNGSYGQGISGTGLGTHGAKVEMFALGIVHWFD